MLNIPETSFDTSQIKQPILLVIIDTEEEFNWNEAFDRKNNSVKNIAHQEKAQAIFTKYGVKPTYVIDYPVASQAEGIEPLKAIYNDNRCDIGAHLHPWVTPPFTEDVNNFNSFPGNLSHDQEYEKLKILTETIAKNFDFNPTIYKAGRYGVGTNTSNILKKLGYIIDCSIVPNTDFSQMDGPDFSYINNCQPYYFSDKQILEVPLTADYVGLLAKKGNTLYNKIQSDQYLKFRVPGILSRLGLFERIRLSPEGHTLDELKRLTLSMLKQDHKIFCLTYHSSSLMIGGSPYVTCEDDLALFLKTIEQYLAFFSDTVKGNFSTLKALKKKQ